MLFLHKSHNIYDEKAQDIAQDYHTKYIYGMNKCKKRYKNLMETEESWYVRWYSRFISSPLVHHYFGCNVPNLNAKVRIF